MGYSSQRSRRRELQSQQKKHAARLIAKVQDKENETIARLNTIHIAVDVQRIDPSKTFYVHSQNQGGVVVGRG